MTDCSRRKLLGVASAVATSSLAGCLDTVGEYLGSEQEGEFLVVGTDLVHAPGYRWEAASYPEDVVVQVAVENRRPSRQSATLVVTLRYDPPDGETIRWEERDELNEGRGVSPTIPVIFEDVWIPDRAIEHYHVSAEIVEDT